MYMMPHHEPTYPTGRDKDYCDAPPPSPEAPRSGGTALLCSLQLSD